MAFQYPLQYPVVEGPCLNIAPEILESLERLAAGKRESDPEIRGVLELMFNKRADQPLETCDTLEEHTMRRHLIFSATPEQVHAIRQLLERTKSIWVDHLERAQATLRGEVTYPFQLKCNIDADLIWEACVGLDHYFQVPWLVEAARPMSNRIAEQ